MRRKEIDAKDVGGAPNLRVRCANAAEVAPDRDYVLYWMITARRARWNFALDRAVAWARALGKPLLVHEALRVDYPWASDRLHRFILDGMADNETAFAAAGVAYYPYIEESKGAGKGLLAALAKRACVIVTDEFPCFFVPHMVEAAATKIDVALEVVDGNGLMPLAATTREFTAAAHFRRYVQRELPQHVMSSPAKNPFAKGMPAAARLPKALLSRWPRAGDRMLAGDHTALAALPIDHEVPPSPMRGGTVAASKALRRFVKHGLASYVSDRNEPAREGTSRLSPYLHFGHISAHEICDAVARHENWSHDRLSTNASGSRQGWWGMSEGAEAFLDQLIVWRELGYNRCARRPSDYDTYESLPDWARATLEGHAADKRPHLYSLRELEEARTHDELWNAAQRQLRREGWYHNYMRMLWGKKILEWSKSPRHALAAMIHIMNRWSLDGRNPNSYSGYLWTLGLYDHPWPSRPVFGEVRSMSSKRTAAKVDVRPYLEAFGDDAAPRFDFEER